MSRTSNYLWKFTPPWHQIYGHTVLRKDLSNHWDKRTNAFCRESLPAEHFPSLNMLTVLLLPLILASSISATPFARQNTRQYNIYNKCPTAIDLYIAGTNQGTILTNGSVSRTLGTGAGYFFTDANGGSKNANRTIYAGFYEVCWIPIFTHRPLKWTIPQDFYYIVSDPEHANTGLQVKPKDRNPVCYFSALFPFKPD